MQSQKLEKRQEKPRLFQIYNDSRWLSLIYWQRLCFLQKDLRFTNRSRTLQCTVQANRAGASMGSQLQCSSKPQHHCTYCSVGYRCCSNCHSFRLLRSLPKKREKNRLNLIFHIFNGRCAFLPNSLVYCAFLILFLVFFRYLLLAECLFCSSL